MLRFSFMAFFAVIRDACANVATPYCGYRNGLYCNVSLNNILPHLTKGLKMLSGVFVVLDMRRANEERWDNPTQSRLWWQNLTSTKDARRRSR